MPVEVIMPKVDMDMSSGKIVAWHATPGDKIEKGAPLFDIETDKAAMEVEAPASGILRYPVPEGIDIPIGQPVAWLYGEEEPIGKAIAGVGTLREEPSPTTDANSPACEAPDTSRNEDSAEPAANKIRATPLARALAREAGINLDDMNGSGAGGRIQGEDVRAMLKARSGTTDPVAPIAEPKPLAVTRAGDSGGAPILLLHGFASDAGSWTQLEKHLDDQEFIRLDLPCHGQSPLQPIESFAALASEIRKTFDRLDVDRVHLVGHSVGGALALALADSRERTVESLTLIAPAGLGPDINGATLAGICRASKRESLTPWLRTLVADEALITEGYARSAMQPRLAPSLRAAQMALADTLFPDGVQAFDLIAALNRLTVPTRIIWGKRDQIIPWRHALRAPGRVGLHLFERLGHLPQIEAPEEVGKIIRISLG